MQRSWIAAAAGGLVLALAGCQPLETPPGGATMQPLPRGKVLAVTPSAANPDVATVWLERDDGTLALVWYDHWNGTVGRSVTIPRQ
jgi:hypothetical protein